MKILFTGDSITASGRDQANKSDLGHGFALMMSEMITESFPECEFTFYNTGVPGNRAEQLALRLDTDLTALEPELTVLMIGVNDAWCRFCIDRVITDDDFEESTRTILEAARSLGSAVVVLEPYLFPDEKHFPAFAELDGKIRVLRKLSREYADAYVALHGAFAEQIVTRDWTDFSVDGVHPNETGARFIAEKAIAAVLPIIKNKLANS